MEIFQYLFQKQPPNHGFILKHSQYNNDATQLKKLLMFEIAVTYTVNEKRRQFQNQEVF